MPAAVSDLTVICREVFDAVVCFEEKVMHQVLEGESDWDHQALQEAAAPLI